MAELPQFDARTQIVREDRRASSYFERIIGDLWRLLKEHTNVPPVGLADPHPQYRLEQPVAAMYGTAESGWVNNTGYTRIDQYANGGVFYDEHSDVSLSIDLTEGEITVSEQVVAKLTYYAIFEQGTATQGEQAELWLNGDSLTRVGLSVFDVATNKTLVRSFSGSHIVVLEPDTYWLELSATGGLGQWGTGRASFSIEVF